MNTFINRCSLISCVIGSKAKIADKMQIKDSLIGVKQELDEELIDEQTNP